MITITGGSSSITDNSIKKWFNNTMTALRDRPYENAFGTFINEDGHLRNNNENTR